MHLANTRHPVYENPADESRAPELWKNSGHWLKVERLLYIHSDLIKETRTHLHELASGDPKSSEPWLGSVPDELEKLTGTWDRDIIAPTSALSDLMYKSVGIRDARHSLQLGLSMWRLSWITFIFLPLTFTVGFFGMNVDTFAENPSIKWWFVVSCPILAAVLILWYGVKHSLSTQRQNPLRRGVYEALYHELATAHSALWSRKGPRKGIVPVGWWNGIKWRLVSGWFGEDKVRPAVGYDPATMEFGAVSRAKQWLVRRWLVDLPVLTESDLPTTAVETMVPDPDLKPFEGKMHIQNHSHKDKADLSAVEELLTIATPVAIAELDPTAASRLQERVPVERLRSLSPRNRLGGDGRRSESRGSSGSGVMVEERVGGEGEGEDEGANRVGGGEGRDGDGDERGDTRGGRLGVPR